MDTVIYVNIVVLLFAYLGRYKKAFLIFAFLCIFLFLSFRINFGSDYKAYLYYFLQISEGGYSYEEVGKEYGWFLINYLCRNITFPGLVALHALLYVISFYLLIVKTVSSKFYWLATFILIFDPDNMLIHLSAMRQSLAICFLIMGCLWLNGKKKNKLPSFISFLIAASFHISSLVFTVAYFFLILTRKGSVNKMKGLLILVSSVALFPISLMLISLFPIPQNYSTYLEETSSSIGIGFIITLFLFVFYLFNEKYIKSPDKIYIRSVEVGYFLTPIRYGIPMFGRIIFYFSVFNIVGFPILLQNIKKRNIKWIGMFVMIIFILFRFFMFFQSDITGESYERYYFVFDYL